MHAKLHTLKFYYLFIKKYILDHHIEIVESDTDFVYCTICRKSFEKCVPEELKRSYFAEKRDWVDVFSKYAYVKCMKNKCFQSVVAAFSKILK